MRSYNSLLLLLVAVIATSMASTMDADVPQELSMDVRSLRGVEEEVRRYDMHLHCRGCFRVFRYYSLKRKHFLTLVLCYALRNRRLFLLQRGLHRNLQRKFDIFTPEDVCKNGEGDYGVCDQSRFPQCVDGRTLICYNRRPMREFFYADTRQPFYYIDYDNVFCYPDTWGGCSSCSPGRYCLSESRCILDEQNYVCEQWL
jgi:hypothetical protein